MEMRFRTDFVAAITTGIIAGAAMALLVVVTVAASLDLWTQRNHERLMEEAAIQIDNRLNSCQRLVERIAGGTAYDDVLAMESTGAKK